MNKLVLIVVILVFHLKLNAQWITKKVDNGFDEPYKICYNRNQYGDLLKLEDFGGIITLYIQQDYFCDDEVNIDVAFLVNGEWKRYNLDRGVVNGVMIIQADLSINSEFPEFSKNFRLCTKFKVRLNNTTCEPEIFEFNMSGSTAALTFMSKP